MKEKVHHHYHRRKCKQSKAMPKRNFVEISRTEYFVPSLKITAHSMTGVRRFMMILLNLFAIVKRINVLL